MRFPLPVITAICIAGSIPLTAFGEDRKLMDRINNPDMERVFDASSMTFGAGSSFATKEFQTGKAYIKEFHFVDRVRTKEFATKASQFAEQSATAQGQQFTTSEVAENLRNAHQSSGHSYATSTFETRESRDATRVVPTEAYSTGDYEGQGTRQRELDAQTKSKGNMTIDEVRELLNKSR